MMNKSGLGSTQRFSTRPQTKPVPGLLGGLYSARPARTPTSAVERDAAHSADVWPQVVPAVDSSRVDRAQAALRAKLQTLNGVTHPNGFDQNAEDCARKWFAQVARNGSVDEKSFVELLVKRFNFAGYEEDAAALFRRYDIERAGRLPLKDLAGAVVGKGELHESSVIGKVREILARRAGGTSTLKSLGLQFKIMDTSQDGTVSREELQIGMEKFLRAFNVTLGFQEVQNLFNYFDVDGGGGISYDEFILGIRGRMNAARRAIVRMAFDVIDADHSGEITLEEVSALYDVSQHPLVKAGKMTPEEAIRNFMKQWGDKNGDAVISLSEFEEYYEWVSASIDNDQYFELMIRNAAAWHLAGGKGVAENTSNLRVLVTHSDGRQTVEMVVHDLGLKKTDVEGIKKRLRAQGLDPVAVSVAGGV